MHEVSIALSLVEGVSEQASARGIERVVAVHVRIGVMAGVVKDALLFAWDLAAEGTIAEGSRLVVETVPLVVWCPRCSCEREISGGFALQCPVCNTLAPEIRQGREMALVGVEVPDAVSIG
jgi:hydrogenase nickel incorporation protein HypA/HybF